jgi:hypothetical protein
MKVSNKIVREFAIQFLIRIEKKRDILVWNILSIRNRKRGDYFGFCHFLILKDPRYLSAGIIAIHSFLARNRKYIAVIHTDNELYAKVKEFAEKSIYRERIEIIQSHAKIHWTEKKYELLMSLQGKKDLYLDVDTRCNNKINIGVEVTCFVDEGKILEQHPYSAILREFSAVDFPNKSQMLNTSFFTWNGHQLPEKYQDSKLYKKVFLSASTFSKERLSEQIALSMLVTSNFPNYEGLKRQDKSFDKGVIESSYLGATGRFIYRR